MNATPQTQPYDEHGRFIGLTIARDNKVTSIPRQAIEPEGFSLDASLGFPGEQRIIESFPGHADSDKLHEIGKVLSDYYDDQAGPMPMVDPVEALRQINLIVSR